MSTLFAKFRSGALSCNGEFYIHLPDKEIPFFLKDNPYYNRPTKTMILLHGYSGDCTDWLYSSAAQDFSMKYNLAIVMPSGGISFYVDKKASGHHYCEFIGKDLVKYLRDTFNIALSKEDTYIGGLSMGAQGASTIGLAHPEVFSKIFCMSGVAAKPSGGRSKIDLNWFGEGENLYTPGNMAGDKKLVNTKQDGWYSAKKIVEEGLERPEFYLTIGDKDFLLELTRSFKKYMDDLGYNIYYEEIPGYAHEWDFWDLKVREFLYSGCRLGVKK